MDNTEKKINKKDIMKIIFLLVILFLIFGVGLFFYGKLQRKEEPINVTVVQNTIDKYGYYINENASQYYKDEFEILKEMANNDETLEEDIIKQVAKLYVIDLLSLNNKINKYEVTSSQYYHSDKRDMHTKKVLETFYNLLEDNAFNNRNQELPEVSNVEITNFQEDTYKIDKETIPCNIINLSVTYVKDYGYDKNVVVTITPDNNNYSVIKYEPVTNKK